MLIPTLKDDKKQKKAVKLYSNVIFELLSLDNGRSGKASHIFAIESSEWHNSLLWVA